MCVREKALYRNTDRPPSSLTTQGTLLPEDEDEIETAVGEAALAPAGTKTAELVDLMADNKMLRRDLAARDEEIAALKASLREKGEEIEELDLFFKERIEALEDELAREKDKNKTGRRQTAVSPLSDATNA